ncbi:MAG: mechanosensitive ion channel family protein [Bacteroidales bacterium]|nr:mechanosensitive ion channel family protein [Bacteroidales bacterium]
MRSRYLALLCALLLPVLPVRTAAQAAQDTTRTVSSSAEEVRVTLTSLLDELRQSYSDALMSDSLLINNPERREEMALMVRSADELTIRLYSQRPDYTFDMAFALENVTRVYNAFLEQMALPSNYLADARAGLTRYTLLEQTLRDMYLSHPVDSLISDADSLLLAEYTPPEPLGQQDPENAVLLDSCLYYTGALTTLYGNDTFMALQDSIYFAETKQRLKEAYEYAQASYADSQKNRYIGGNLNVSQIIKNWDTIIPEIRNDLYVRYHAEDPLNPGAWNGQYVLSYAKSILLILLLCLLVAGAASFLVYKFVRPGKIYSFRPLLAAILCTLLFIFGVAIVNGNQDNTYWQMAYKLLKQFAWLTLAILVSLLIRIREAQAKPSLVVYLPTLVLAFTAILMRVIFLPAGVVPLVFPPVLLVFIIWQAAANLHYRKQVARTDLRYLWVSEGVMLAVCILSLCGFSMIGVLLLTFWTFQLAMLHTITTLYYLVMRYAEVRVARRKATYHTENPLLPLEDKNAFIEVTWLYDLLRMVVVPIITLLSFPLGIQLTSRAYQLSLTGETFMKQPLIHFRGLESITPFNILLVVGLFFVFRYLIHLCKGLSRVIKLRNVIEKKGDKAVPIKESEVNMSLTNTLFSLIGWLLYLTIIFAILNIPTAALTAISTGLAAGIGFALKDLINNFFYGIQLMAGRIRVGDKISCDGVRGIVKRVSYQTTQVEDEDGSLIAFTNTDLFSKNFRNLNAGKNYELLKLRIGIKYGTSIAKARDVILEALEPLRTKDASGRDIMDPSFPIEVRFDSLGDSSVNLIVALYSTVETHYTFPSRAMEAIYDAFYANGIEIPFPQRDVYVKSVPENKQSPTP